VADDEAEHGLPRSREPELGFVWAVYRWARQERLERVLTATVQRGVELSAGDFIRWCKQVLDLLDQIAATESAVAGTARAAVGAVRHGVVAQSMLA
jgi:ATP-dependent RNA helicase HelY